MECVVRVRRGSGRNTREESRCAEDGDPAVTFNRSVAQVNLCSAALPNICAQSRCPECYLTDILARRNPPAASGNLFTRSADGR